MFEELLQKPKFWSSYGPYNDIVLSSRVRLARNMQAVSFPNRMEENEIALIKAAAEKFRSESEYRDTLSIIYLAQMESNEKRFLRERNLVTHEMETSVSSFILINSSADDFAILVNEEDHFRIQVIKPGLQFMDTYRLANKIDDELNRFVPYAWSNDYGYLTTCPSNLGTGLKASAILHLPVLTIKKQVSSIIPLVKNSGVEIKGTMGDIGKSPGSLYQVSNKISLGISEVDIVEILDEAVNKILEMEDAARDAYISGSRVDMEDMVWRSYGILKYSRKLSYAEAMEHLSNIRLGVILAIIKKIEIGFVNNLMVYIQFSHLQSDFEKNFSRLFSSRLEADEYRADYIRRNLL
ncbi:MAG: hypothetical protein GY754_22890 [bacterium]|nr:hypothetical protein [bacterium]